MISAEVYGLVSTAAVTSAGGGANRANRSLMNNHKMYEARKHTRRRRDDALFAK